MTKVIAHIAGPSGSGKTELCNTLEKVVGNIHLIDLDYFDGEAEYITGMHSEPKDNYTDAQLLKHHTVKQQLIDEVIHDSEKPIIFFGHIEEAGHVISLPCEHKLVLINALQGALRRAKHLGLSLEEMVALAKQGEQDILFFKERGYIPVTSRKVYRQVIAWSHKETT